MFTFFKSACVYLKRDSVSFLLLTKNSLTTHYNKNSIIHPVNYMMTNETKKLKTEKISKIGTHNGTFHCDEVLACHMLLQLENMKDAEIIRSRNPDILKTCDIVVDVGKEFDESQNLFDHHQRDFNETFSSLRPEFGDNYNIKLSSAGLIYTYFGEQVIKSILKKENVELDSNQLKAVYEQVYKSFIMEIDAIDNGVPICEGEQKYFITTHLSERVKRFNPQWNDPTEVKEVKQFYLAVDYVGETFKEKILNYVKHWLPAREIVKNAINESKSIYPTGEIIELKQFCPWSDHLFRLEEELNLKGLHKYVLFSDTNNCWRVICVPNKPGSFVCRKFLSENWRGLEKNLPEISGIKDASFCHSTGFIGGASSREGVFEMAVKSLENMEGEKQ